MPTSDFSKSIQGKSLFQAPTALIRERFRCLQSRHDLAILLEVSHKELCATLYGSKQRRHYRVFNIPKRSGGQRRIDAPPPLLKILQRKLATILGLIYRKKPSAHGFVNGRSIVSNASPHLKRRHVVNLDIKDFFPTIHLGRIRGVLEAEPYRIGPEAAIAIAQICTTDDGILPQGAPTSPIISNVVCRSLDSALQELSQRARCTYTRYADDITFSTTQTTLSELIAVQDHSGRWQISHQLRDLIEAQTFKINDKKFRVQSQNQRQLVTGLIVNEFCNIPRKFLRELRAMIHKWDTAGYEAASKEYSDKFAPPGYKECSDGQSFKRVVHGRLAHVKHVRGQHDAVYRKLLKRLSFADQSHPQRMRVFTPVEVEPTPIRGVKNPSGSWANVVARCRKSVYFLLLKKKDKDGVLLDRVGSAFCFRPGMLATAGHNLKVESVKIIPPDGVEIDDPTLYSPACTSPSNTGMDYGTVKLPIELTSLSHPIPTQFRIPEIGEEVLALGFPVVPLRQPTLVALAGTVTAITRDYGRNFSYIQVSMPPGGGLSGAVLLDRRGLALGIMIEGLFEDVASEKVVPVSYAQAVPLEYVTAYPPTSE